MAIDKNLHEGFTRFFEHPTREGLRDLLRHGIGEIDQMDFKEELPDKVKLAKHLLAFANSGGGVIVVGITDGERIEPKGVSELIDKADIQKRLSRYLPATLEYEVLDFIYRDSEYAALKGKMFQVLVIDSDDKQLPYLCTRGGDGIKDNCVYIRKGTNTTEADHEDLQRLINRRLETGFSSSHLLSLEEHLEQLRLLYRLLERNVSPLAPGFVPGMIGRGPDPDGRVPLPLPEPFDRFLARCIERKKLLIEQLLKLRPLP